MRLSPVLAIAGALAVSTLAVPAEAGCLKGAIVGGLAGKLVGHGYAGAAAGCAYGAHRSNSARRNMDVQNGNGRSSYNGNRY